MIQLLDPNAVFLNAPSNDFKRFDIPHEDLIELTSWNEASLLDCVQLMVAGERGKPFSCTIKVYLYHLKPPEKSCTIEFVFYSFMLFLSIFPS
jgi:hypothetical protein